MYLRLKLLQAVVIVASILLTRPSDGQVIGIFADAAGTRCDLSVGLGTSATGYILFRRGPLDGIQGWEFRVQGVPSGWIAVENCLACYGIGDLFGVGSTRYRTKCEEGDSLIIGEFSIVATTEETNALLTIEARQPPSNPLLACPWVVLCDAPAYTAVCVQTTAAVVNGPCSVSVISRTWTEIKRLYGE